MTRTDSDSKDLTPAPSSDDDLYFFPDRSISEAEARAMLRDGSEADRAEVISYLLRFAQWDDIWTYVDRDEVRAVFDTIELPDKLRAAWARMLKIGAPVG